MKFLIVIFLFIFNFSYSQDTTNVGNVSIIMSSKIDSLIKSKSNKINYTWKVIVDFSTDKKSLIETKDRLIKYHPDKEVFLYFDSPYWKIKVGNFDTKEEADDFINSIRKYYKDKALFTILENDEYIRKKSTK